MAQLSEQLVDFGVRLAKVEGRAENIGQWGAAKFGEIRERLDAISRTVATIEAHDTKQSARLDALEAASAQSTARLDQIEADLGTLALGAEIIAAKDEGP